MALIWVGFVVFVLLLLALDLGVFHRTAREVSVREALGWSAVWIVVALAFTAFIYSGYEHHWLGLGLSPDVVDRSAHSPEGRINDGSSAVVKYLTGYVVERSLSVDNLFVIALIFTFFRVPSIYQHRVLFWGILGALLLRGVMIALGARLISEFTWILYVFGVFLIITAVKMLVTKGEEGDPDRNPLVRLVRRLFPVTDRLHGEHFLVRAGNDASDQPAAPGEARAADGAVRRARPGRWMLTPLAVTLVAVETSDLIFAVDSIPAIFAITADPFLVFTSNVFAILGLRALYFALAGALAAFRYLKASLSIVLAVVGVKMLVHSWLEDLLGEHFNLYLLGLVLLILAAGVLASRRATGREKRALAREQAEIALVAPGGTDHG